MYPMLPEGYANYGEAYLAMMGAQHDYTPKPEERRVPPDPTRYDLVWGKAYPCLQYTAVGQQGTQCRGMMQPAKRCFRFEGRLWRKFKCDRCGRAATDWKVQ